MAGNIVEKPEIPWINKIAVSGFKSIRDEQHIDIKPLTILAGANSSGKSSMMQPLLLIKQTMEAPFDPGALLLNGPNVKFTSAEQLLSRFGKEKENYFKIAIDIGNSLCEMTYSRGMDIGFQIESCCIKLEKNQGHEIKITATMDRSQLVEYFGDSSNDDVSSIEVIRNRSFFQEIICKSPDINFIDSTITFSCIEKIEEAIDGLIHLPSLRGNPERTYPVTAVGNTFPGTFDVYTASVIFQWQSSGNTKKVKQVSDDLKKLGLTWKVDAHKVNDAQVELRVGRLPKIAKGDAQDLVNITDVGFGVSQTLPIITALRVARPGQIVYLEQPEIHLHPRAQVALAEILADAAKSGVCVIVETHSSLLILSLQTLVAEQKLSPDLIALNWFKRDKEGVTTITQGQMDDAGRFGDWPEDFDDVSLNAENRYLNAVDKRMAV